MQRQGPIDRDWRSLAIRWGAWGAVCVALLFIAVFVELSEEVVEIDDRSARLLGVDTCVLRFIARFRRPWLNAIAVDLTALGSPLVVALFTLTFGALLLTKADRRGAISLVVISLASALLTSATKALLERSRPSVVPRLVEVTGLSYPSGHSLASAAVYLTAAFVLGRHVSRSGERIGFVIYAAIMVVLIGASRVYLGVHYPSDVLGGIVLGAACAILNAVVLLRFDRRVRSRTSQISTACAPARRAANTPIR